MHKKYEALAGPPLVILVHNTYFKTDKQENLQIIFDTKSFIYFRIQLNARLNVFHLVQKNKERFFLYIST